MSVVYKFNDAYKSIQINECQLPASWINYLSNGELHAFVSQCAGGLLWWKSPLSFRISRYRFQNLPIDSPGFYLYIRERSGLVWSPSWRPTETELDSWCAEHFPGRTVFKAKKGKISTELELFIPPEFNAMIWNLTLSNTGEKISLDIFPYLELSMLDWKQDTDWEYYVKHNLRTWFDKRSEALFYLYHHHYHPKLQDAPLVFIASSEKVYSYCGDRDVFIGYYRSEKNPIAVEKNNCNWKGPMYCGEPCLALQCKVNLAKNATKTISFMIGAEPYALRDWPESVKRAKKMICEFRKKGIIENLRSKLQNWWDEHLSIFECKIPDKDCQRQINIWSPVQSVHTGRYSRSISSSATGIRGMGFRDTCQDMLAIAYRKPEWAKRTFLYLLSQQFEDGHTVHECFPGENRPPDCSKPHSDDHLWLPILAYVIISETGDITVLNEKVPFLSGKNSSSSEATVWEHLLRCFDFTENHLGEHGLPLILNGDWNDAIRKIAPNGKGESMMAAQQYVYTMKLMLQIAQYIHDEKAQEFLLAKIAKMENAILSYGWDGEWWNRGYDGEGKPFGSKNCKYGKIWLNSQTWAVISGVGSPEQHKKAMDSVFKILNTPLGIKKLHPSFKSFPDEPNPYSGYSPGCGENGAIFCHANTWAIIAEALLKRADRAWLYYKQLLPHLAMKKAGLKTYQAEPYAYVSNIVGPENPKFGWANVTQVTGTATWMDIAATQYLLGIRPTIDGLLICPCLPQEWRKATIVRYFRNCRIEVEIINSGSKESPNYILETEDKEIFTDAILPGSEFERKKSIKIIAKN